MIAMSAFLLGVSSTFAGTATGGIDRESERLVDPADQPIG
jgi:hypothetical protein